MSEPGCYSPGFKKPSDVLRMRRKRARSEGVSLARPASGSPLPADIRAFCPGPLLNSRPRPGGAKRRNPFASIENTHGGPAKRLCDPDRPAEPPGGSPTSTPTPPPTPEDEPLFPEDSLEAVLKGPPEPAPLHEQVCPEYPADWSLKTRVLITSPHSFSWAEHPRAVEEAQGLSQHCRAEFHTLPQQIQDPRGCAELRCGFQQCLQYWQHPSLPWLPLFPRINAGRGFSGKSTPWAQDAAVQQSLMGEWSVSLTSLYSLLKARLCPFFYLCSYQFTVLFRAAGLGGAGGVTALVSPTTRGLRQAMRAEGIEFSLPLVEGKRKSSCGEGEPPCGSPTSQQTDRGKEEEEEEGDEEEEEDDDEGCFSWLKEMGVQDKIKKPDSISIKLRKEHGEVRLDHRPESVVLVEGSNTFTLLNFLINCKSLVAAAGPQAGLPPTLLAPAAFRGATLHTLKARSVNVKTQVRTGYRDVCSLELTGPIMPHALHALARLLGPAQRGEFSAALYTHEPSAVLNVAVATHPEQEKSGPGPDLGGCGLQQSTVEQLSQPSMLGKGALRQLHMKEHSYSWRS